jgi:hypothetical protein
MNIYIYIYISKRARAHTHTHTHTGYGEWSQRLELVLQAPDVSGYVCRKELLQMAQERARQHRYSVYLF